MAFPTSLTNVQDGATDIIAAHINALEIKMGIDDSTVPTSLDYKVSVVIPAAIIDAMKQLNPIGTVYSNYENATNPATLFGFGTWLPIEGEVVVGKAATGTFNTAGALVGTETTTLTSAQSGLVGHNHSQNAHNHSQDWHNHGQDAHGHGHNAVKFWGSRRSEGSTAFGSYCDESVGMAAADINGATATNQGTTATNQAATASNNGVAAANAAQAHSNIQPSRVCYVWRRSA